jgi:hypothetical protein
VNNLAASSLGSHKASQPVQEFSHGSGSYSRCEGDHRRRIVQQFRGVSLSPQFLRLGRIAARNDLGTDPFGSAWGQGVTREKMNACALAEFYSSRGDQVRGMDTRRTPATCCLHRITQRQGAEKSSKRDLKAHTSRRAQYDPSKRGGSGQ